MFSDILQELRAFLVGAETYAFSVARACRRRIPSPMARQSTQSSGSFCPVPEVILYTRLGCHLCHEADLLLRSYGLTPQAIDIDADAALQSRYTNCVPVVVIDGRERFRGRVDEVLLLRLLRASE